MADIFYKAGFIESWGRGTLNIVNECKKAHIPEPNFYEERGVVKVIFELPGGNDTLRHGEINEGLNGGLNTLLQTISEHPGIKAKDLPVLLSVCAESPFSSLRLRKKCSFTPVNCVFFRYTSLEIGLSASNIEFPRRPYLITVP